MARLSETAGGVGRRLKEGTQLLEWTDQPRADAEAWATSRGAARHVTMTSAKRAGCAGTANYKKSSGVHSAANALTSPKLSPPT